MLFIILDGVVWQKDIIPIFILHYSVSMLQTIFERPFIYSHHSIVLIRVANIWVIRVSYIYENAFNNMAIMKKPLTDIAIRENVSA